MHIDDMASYISTWIANRTGATIDPQVILKRYTPNGELFPLIDLYDEAYADTEQLNQWVNPHTAELEWAPAGDPCPHEGWVLWRKPQPDPTQKEQTP